MKSTNPKHLFAAMLAACFFACNSPSDTGVIPQDAAALPETRSGFERSALAIKASQLPQKEKIAALEALASRYGHVMAHRENPEPAPAFLGAGESEPEALAKLAAVRRYYTMKWHSVGNNFILGTGHTVKPNQTLTAMTFTAVGSAVDPFIVAFYTTEFTDFGDAALIKVVALNDDNGGSLNSLISWKNKTGSNKRVHIFAFPYAPSLAGMATLTSSVNGLDNITTTDFMDGIAVYDDNFFTQPIAGCTGGPITERFNFRTTEFGDFVYGGMVVNAETMTGARIYNGGLLTDQTIYLPTPTPSGYPNFMLVFASHKGLGGSAVGFHAGNLEQKFSCAN